MFEQLDFWQLFAGLGIFLLGMFMLEESIKNLSGKALRNILKKYTEGKVKSVFTGALSTAILQSSSAVTLLLLAFVSAGLMTLQSGIGVIVGTNIGTTMTSWIVATIGFKVNIEAFALPFVAIGGIGLIFFGTSTRLTNISKLLAGFGLLFLGLDYMKKSMDVWAASADIDDFIGLGFIALLFIGFFFTAIVQSSSAAMAIILSSVHTGIITFEQACVMVIGVNLGTTVKIIIVSMAGSVLKRRVGMSHFSFNLFSAILAIIALKFYVWLIIDVWSLGGEPVIALAVFHTLFNIVGAVLFMPFIPLYVKGLVKFVPEKLTSSTMYISKESASVPETALESLKNEVLHLLQLSMRYNLKHLNIDASLIFSGIFQMHNPQFTKLRHDRQYHYVKQLQAEIYAFSSNFSSEHAPQELENMTRYLLATRMAVASSKTFKDAKNDFEELSNSDNHFMIKAHEVYRKGLMEFYLALDHLINEQINEGEQLIILDELSKQQKKLNSQDKSFQEKIMKALHQKEIHTEQVNYLLTANRSFTLSCRQILVTVSELYLSRKEASILEIADPQVLTDKKESNDTPGKEN